MKRTEKKRKDIIDAAVEEFRFYGFDGARTTRIAKAACVSSRTLYNHFPTKQELFDEIIEIIVAETGAITSEPYSAAKPVREQLITALKDYIEALTDQRYMGLNRLVMTEYLRDLELAQRIAARAEMSNNPVQSIIEGGIQDKKLRDVDPQYASNMLCGAAIRIFFWPQFLVGLTPTEDPETVFETSVDMFLAEFSAD